MILLGCAILGHFDRNHDREFIERNLLLRTSRDRHPIPERPRDRFNSLTSEQPQTDIEKPDHRHARRKTGDNEFLSMLQHFSEEGVRGQIEKSAAYVCHNQGEPKRRSFPQKEKTDYSAKERSGFDCGNPTERDPALQSSADQKAAQREAFRNFVDAESAEKRPFFSVRRGNFRSNSQSQTVGRAVNCQRDDQRGRDFAEMSGGICVEMTGGTSGANVMDIFADEEEQRISGSRRQDDGPPITVAQAFRQNGEERHAQECAGGQTDQRAKRFMRQSQ